MVKITNKKCQYGLNVVLFLIVCIPIIPIGEVMTPFRRGFFCNDDTIKYPYYDKDTIPTWLLLLLGAAIPCVAIIFVEIGLFRDAKKKQICFIICIFLFGMATTNLLTQTTKLMIGRLRPHFLTVCKPDYTKFNCSDGYIEADVCSDEYKAKTIREARLSFVSGHSSMAWYCALYLVLYLEVRFTWKISRLVKPVLQIALLMLALMCSLSRISDYKHHWSDVLGGSLLGVIVAVLTYQYVSDLLKMALPLEKRQEDSLEIDYREEEAYILRGDRDTTYYGGQ
ncbi:phospholipid phosphatase 1-like [Ptychodera flava]|uniref:phospholipid phosphatase 1-like n=1 Tax=Ptychodera flava TaxID=63121 RepID=UPI00396A7383